MDKNIEKVTAAINYIEDHLTENLDLAQVADAVHYSKFYLHRIFTETTGLTIHDYIQRRQLTEAAKLLVCSDRSVLDIALIAGYESRQSFTTAFREMYKKTPNQYREDEVFYPLQLRYILNENPENPGDSAYWQKRIVPAAEQDIPEWMRLVRLVVDGFPCLDEEHYEEQLSGYIQRNQALILRDADTAAGIMLFDERTGSIDFLGVHPQYRKRGIIEAFLQEAMSRLTNCDVNINITTFREGDKADTGHRKMLKSLGFAEAELLVEFGYPTQRLVLADRGGRA